MAQYNNEKRSMLEDVQSSICIYTYKAALAKCILGRTSSMADNNDGGIWWLGEPSSPKSPSGANRNSDTDGDPDSGFLREQYQEPPSTPYTSEPLLPPPPPPTSGRALTGQPPAQPIYDTARTNAPRGSRPAPLPAAVDDEPPGSASTNPYSPTTDRPVRRKRRPSTAPTTSRKRKTRISPATAIVTLVAFIAVIATLAWQFGDAFGSRLPLGIFPTPTRIGHAHSAKIHFQSAKQDITAASSTLVAATDGTGDIPAKKYTASATGIQSAPIKAVYESANSVTFTVTVTNTDPNSLGEYSGPPTSIKSSDGKVKCYIADGQNVYYGKPVTQHCTTDATYQPSAHFADSSHPPLTFVGDFSGGGNAAGYYVPANCGDPSIAQAAARTALQSKLDVPSGSVAIYGPSFSIDVSSLSCNPQPQPANPQASPFTYTQTINGSASATYANTSDIANYQTAQLQKAIPTNYVLADSKICPDGPKAATNSTATKGTITCPATGTAKWNWTPDTLATLSNGIAGATVATATLQLNGTQGITQGSVKIELIDGSTLPQDPQAISFAVDG
jgi:hypothetical protein